MYDARQIANWFIRRARQDGRVLSIMSLLKLTYIAHGWYLEMNKSPLYRNKIEAWQRGPVVPDLYRSFRGQGVHVNDMIPGYSADLRDYDQGFLDQIYKIYGHLDPFTLSDLTHEPGGPWETASKRYGNYAPMFDDDIRRHYEAKRTAAAE